MRSSMAFGLMIVLSGLGIGYLSLFAARPHIRQRQLVRLFPKVELPPFEPVYLIRATTEHVPLKLQAFTRHLRAAARAARKATG